MVNCCLVCFYAWFDQVVNIEDAYWQDTQFPILSNNNGITNMEPNSSSFADKNTVRSDGQVAGPVNWLDHYFGVTRRGSSLRTEILAGIATFLASMYIIVVNPAILSDAGIPFSAALSATVLISFMSSLAMGLYARNPILVAPGSDATLVTLGNMDASMITFFIGMMATAILVILRFNGALILGIALTTLLASPMGRLWGGDVVVEWSGLTAWPDFSAVMQVDIWGALKVAYLPFIFVMLFTNFFDALSCFMALSESANLKDKDGNPRNLKRSMTVDAFASMIAAPLGTSAAQTFIESGAGVAQGGRTGLVAVTIGLMFLPFLFLSPLLSLIPGIATAPALVLVGLFMLAPISKIEWAKFDQAFPAFLAIILMPLTYSITLGIAFGFLSFVLIKLFTGRIEEIKPAMWVSAALSVVMLVTTH